MISVMRALSIVVIAVSLVSCEKPAVTVVQVGRGAVESTVTSVEAGVIEPWQKATLAAPVSGRIVRVHKVEGDVVAAGEVLIELENDHETLRVEETKKELERLKKVGDTAVTEVELDRAHFAHERAKIDCERTRVRATFSGVVAEINARVGEMTFGSMGFALGSSSAGQERMVYVVDDSRRYVEAEIDESDVFRVRVGQPVKVSVGGVERVALAARVLSISPTVSTQESESRTARVKAEIIVHAPANGSGAALSSAGSRAEVSHGASILIGMSADIEILVDRLENVLRVPTTAILERGDEKHVFVVRGGKLAQQPITIGLGNWEMTEIRSGLSAGELVVLPTDVSLLSAGVEVEVVVAQDRDAGPSSP